VYSAQNGEPPHVLDYYVAFYLFPAITGKALGWVAANVTLFIEMYIGLLLGMLWFLRAARTRRFLAASLIFMLASGLDIVGQKLVGAPFRLGDHIEYWSTTWQYSSNTTLAYWVPYQAIVGWIVTGIILCYASRPAGPRCLLFIASTGMLWSPMVTIGALPLAGLVSLQSVRGDIRRLMTWQNTLGVIALLLPVGLMYLANVYYADPQPNDASGGHGQFIWQYYDLATKWPKLVMFEVLQVGLFAAIIVMGGVKANISERMLLALALGTLVILPIYRYGEANVFVLRTSIPALFILWVFVARLLLDNHTSNRQLLMRVALGMLLLVGVVAPASEIARSLQHGGWQLQVPRFDTTPDMQTGIIDGQMTREHVGDPAAWFFTHLARDDMGQGT
jgi:hypothetical protein